MNTIHILKPWDHVEPDIAGPAHLKGGATHTDLTPEQQAAHEARIEAETERVQRELAERGLLWPENKWTKTGSIARLVERIADLLFLHGPLTARELATALGCEPKQIGNAIHHYPEWFTLPGQGNKVMPYSLKMQDIPARAAR